MKCSRRIFAQLYELTHRRMCSLRLGHIGNDPARHLHRDERLAVDVGIRGQPEVLETLTEIEFAPSRLCQCGCRCACKKAYATNCYRAPAHLHVKAPDGIWTSLAKFHILQCPARTCSVLPQFEKIQGCMGLCEKPSCPADADCSRGKLHRDRLRRFG